jgi:hypothetical protein
MCHLNAHDLTPTNTGGARGLNAALRSSLTVWTLLYLRMR